MIKNKNTRFLLILLLIIPMLACQGVYELINIDSESTGVPLLTQYFITPSPPNYNEEIPTIQSTQEISQAQEVAPTPTFSPLHKEKQATIFHEIWNTVNTDYLYEDFNGVDWNQVKEENLEKITSGLTTEEFYEAMTVMVFLLKDEHSVYLDPQAVYADNLDYSGTNDYVGIGIWHSTVPEENYTTILLTFPNSPAEKAGLKPHDNLLLVNGEEIVDEEGHFKNEILLGDPGTSVTILVQTPGDNPREITLLRQKVSSAMPVPSASFTTTNGQKIGYLILPSVYDLTIPNSFRLAYEDLAKDGDLDGLIIDNRINGGGSDFVAKQILRLFTDGTIGYYVNRKGKTAFKVSGDDFYGSQDIPLVMLVGEDSVSFGEIMPAILQDLGRATIIGETTLGNVEVLYGYDFEDHSQLWLAHDTFQTAENFEINWEETGVIPDIMAPAEWDKITIFDDPAITASLEFFDCQQSQESNCYLK